MSTVELDAELEGLIGRLNIVHEAVGGKKEKVNEEIVGADGKIDRFMELKVNMMSRLGTIKNLMQQISNQEKTGSNPKDVVMMQSQLRENMKHLQEDMKEVDALYKKEATKRKSKFSPDELELRKGIRDALAAEVQAIKDAQLTKFAPGYQGRKLATMEESELFRGGGADKSGGGAGGAGASSRVVQSRNMEMTDIQRQTLQQIRERDAQFDSQLDDVSKGLDTLKEIASAQNEEVQRQNIMLDGLAQNIDKVHEKVQNVNASLKEKLDEIGGADKMCMNIMCLVLMLGIMGVIYKLTAM